MTYWKNRYVLTYLCAQILYSFQLESSITYLIPTA